MVIRKENVIEIGEGVVVGKKGWGRDRENYRREGRIVREELFLEDAKGREGGKDERESGKG